MIFTQDLFNYKQNLLSYGQCGKRSKGIETVRLRAGHWFYDLVSCNAGNGLVYHPTGLRRDKIMQKKM